MLAIVMSLAEIIPHMHVCMVPIARSMLTQVSEVAGGTIVAQLSRRALVDGLATIATLYGWWQHALDDRVRREKRLLSELQRIAVSRDLPAV